ncbi:PHB depolymerase family esterase [soil metagenome]
MRRLGDTVARLGVNRRLQTAGPSSDSRLKPVVLAGPNPGALDAFAWTPARSSGAALVVVLHGCAQTAEAYDHGTGWSRHAEQQGFAVLFPQQRRANNPGLCFNWFAPDDVAQDRGEAASIAAMIGTMVRQHDLDPGRIFITGLSAGGAMTAAMLAAFPHLFAGGAVIAGLPAGAASSIPQAFEAMRGGGAASAAVSIDRVRRASPGSGRWPRIAIFHGTADHTVDAVNADGLVAQWTGVHGLTTQPDNEVTTGRCRRRLWSNASGEILVEDYRMEGMGHGVPLDVKGLDPLGAVGPFMLEVGFSATARLVEAWGLGDPLVGKAKQTPRPDSASGPAAPKAEPAFAFGSGSGVNGVQAVIEGALRRAGLMP